MPKTNTDSGKEILTNLTNTIADESTKTNPKIEATSNVSSGNIAVVPPLIRSDSSKRKRELPEWMSRSSGRKEMALKKMKSNSLFKWSHVIVMWFSWTDKCKIQTYLQLSLLSYLIQRHYVSLLKITCQTEIQDKCISWLRQIKLNRWIFFWFNEKLHDCFGPTIFHQ